MPASPVSNTTCPMPSAARSQRSASQPTSCSRPTTQCQASRRRYIETCLCSAVVQDPIYHDGLGQAFEGLSAERLADKIAMDQLRCGLADDHRIQFSESLESSRNIGCRAEGKLFLPPSTADVTHHD